MSAAFLYRNSCPACGFRCKWSLERERERGLGLRWMLCRYAVWKQVIWQRRLSLDRPGRKRLCFQGAIDGRRRTSLEPEVAGGLCLYSTISGLFKPGNRRRRSSFEPEVTCGLQLYCRPALLHGAVDCGRRNVLGNWLVNWWCLAGHAHVAVIINLKSESKYIFRVEDGTKKSKERGTRQIFRDFLPYDPRLL